VDVIVTSTGYKTHEFCRRLRIRVEGGLDIQQAWAEGACSFEAAALAGFPNFFMVGGPQTTIGNLSYTACAELQASYIVRALQLRGDAGVRAIVPTEEAQKRFLSDIRGSAGRTVWKAGCTSWYLDDKGGLDVWPKSVQDFISMMAKGPQRQDFHLIR
jgi:cation diffusion facilitator CzcD-associated flavoprotein CzcO